MKKTVLSIVVLLSLLFFASCDKYKEIKQFATDFAAAVQSGNKSEITKMYPDAAVADSLVFAFDAENAEIETLDDGSIKIALGDGKDIILAKNDADGSLKVKASHGVFAYPSDRLDLGMKTGWYDKSLDDIQNADRLADSLFVKYLNDKIVGTIIADLKSKVKVTKSVATHDLNNLRGLCTVVVSNQNGRQIEGNEYVVTAKLYDSSGGLAFGSREYVGSRTLTGKPIPANGQTTYSFSYDVGGYPNDPVCNISVNPKLENILDDYQPTGKEYEEYLSLKTK